MPNDVLTPAQAQDTYLATKDLDWAGIQIRAICISATPHRSEVEGRLIDLQRAVCHIAEEAGFAPKAITNAVHAGHDKIEPDDCTV